MAEQVRVIISAETRALLLRGARGNINTADWGERLPDGFWAVYLSEETVRRVELEQTFNEDFDACLSRIVRGGLEAMGVKVVN